jgi:hypothetical protein
MSMSSSNDGERQENAEFLEMRKRKNERPTTAPLATAPQGQVPPSQRHQQKMPLDSENDQSCASKHEDLAAVA